MTQGRPTAAPAHFPYDHPSMAVVMANECRECFAPLCSVNTSGVCRSCNGRRMIKIAYDRARYERERRSAAG